jgi:hypothetical protein
MRKPIQEYSFVNVNAKGSHYRRQSTAGNHITDYIVRQLPIHSPETYAQAVQWESNTTLKTWLTSRVLELSYTAWDVQPFARDCSYDGPPFRWDEERRFLLRCELDAAFFHLYGIERDDVDYIMDTFPIVRRKDAAAHGEYRTKRVILELYDEMAEAARTGTEYRTRLDPPPADSRVAYPESTKPAVPGRYEMPRLPEMPSTMPAPHPSDAPMIVWALLHASGGSLRHLDLGRAFALWSKPTLLLESAPPELVDKANDWAARVSQRTIVGGTLRQTLEWLADRQAASWSTDDASRVVVNTTLHTPDESKIDPWIRFEARLVLAVLASLPPEQAVDVDVGLSDEDRKLPAAGAA